MTIVIGTRLFGGTDKVPGLFHVATKFFHINFLPLVPTSSYLILEQRFLSRSCQGVEIPLNGKSVALGYIRAVATIGVIVTLIWCFVVQSDQGYSDSFWVAVISFCLTLLVACLLMWHKVTRNASYERANELAGIMANKLGPNAGLVCQRLVDRHFGRVAFVVVTTNDDDHEIGTAEESDLQLAEGTNKVTPQEDVPGKDQTVKNVHDIV